MLPHTLTQTTTTTTTIQFQAAVEVVVNPSDEATWCFLAAPTQPVAQCVQQSVAELGVHADLVHAVGQYAQQHVDSTSQAWMQPTQQRHKPDIGVALQPQVRRMTQPRGRANGDLTLSAYDTHSLTNMTITSLHNKMPLTCCQ